MNEKKRERVIVVLACLVLITGTYCIYHFRFEYSPDLWFIESIQDDDYVIFGYEIGLSMFGGQTRVEISMYDHVENQQMTIFETTIQNRRKKLTTDNYCIEHNEDYIKITLIDADGQRRAYRFYFKDFQYNSWDPLP